MSSIQLIDPTQIPHWDTLISRHSNANPFHSSGWARVLRDTYGFTPYYACVFKGDTLSTCLPLMEVNSFLTGKRGVSLPFTDFCEPLLNGTTPYRDLLEFAVNFGNERRWKYLELRGSEFSTIPRDGRRKMEDGSNCLASAEGEGRWKREDGRKGTDNLNIPIFQHSNIPSSHSSSDSLAIGPDASRSALCAPRPAPCALRSYSHHLLDLSIETERLFKNLRASTRRNIRKAEKEGVTVRFSTDLEAVKIYFRLHCLTRKRHGVPSQPWAFFENIHKNLIAFGQGFVALAVYQGNAIAGAVFLTLGDRAIFKFGASDSRYHSVRPNNHVMGEAIRRLAEDGFMTLSFGRTDPENQGLIQFKSGWGPMEERLDYSRYDFSKQDFISGNGKGPAGYEKVFQKLPEPALRLMGKVLYRHFGS